MHETKREGYIRRIENVLKTDVAENTNEIIFTEEATREILELLKEQPEQKKGKWIDDCSCSICHWIHEDDDGFALITKYNYCPNCGADMRGEQDELISRQAAIDGGSGT